VSEVYIEGAESLALPCAFEDAKKKLTWTLHVLCFFSFNVMVLVDFATGLIS